ncbi:hypothetical protein EH165_11380 [Nakamurella antarctica]|uniref:Uncharacterized protein n=1 Tax=Nakamurella antarctica TaxID=1902245 RepID=A0A3G8ZX89_9ACTN|nr:hypothetical protein EH165_11380 [Nakamurella antarctica]
MVVGVVGPVVVGCVDVVVDEADVLGLAVIGDVAVGDVAVGDVEFDDVVFDEVAGDVVVGGVVGVDVVVGLVVVEVVVESAVVGLVVVDVVGFEVVGDGAIVVAEVVGTDVASGKFGVVPDGGVAVCWVLLSEGVACAESELVPENGEEPLAGPLSDKGVPAGFDPAPVETPPASGPPVVIA